jgi:hypothetical protein
MFYRESVSIQSSTTIPQEDIEAVDEYLFKNQGKAVRICRISDFTEIPEDKLIYLLDNFEVSKVVQKYSLPICPIDDCTIEPNNDGKITCDLCDRTYEEDQCRYETVFEPRQTAYECGDSIPFASNEYPKIDGIAPIGGCTDANRKADVVFVHGLNGDASSTWHPDGKPHDFFPKWISEDFPQCGVWSLGYDASSSNWTGNSMPVFDRATNVLSKLELAGIGNRPTIFITHSLGGLVIKKCLQQAMSLGRPAWKKISDRTAGIMFLSTPHAGSDLTSYLSYISTLYRATSSIDDLKPNSVHLRELNLWFRNNSSTIQIEVFFEKRKTSNLLVVDEFSADPGIPGVIPIPLDEDHITICKPMRRSSQIYAHTTQFINKLITQ